MNKTLAIFAISGIFYIATEVSYNAIGKGLARLVGHTSLWMLLVGGLLGLVLSYIGRSGGVLRRRLPYFLVVLIGALSIDALELVSGIVLNLWLGFNLWSYQGERFNILGQISLYHSFLWVLLTPAAFWLEDVLKYYIQDAVKPAPFLDYYIKVLTRRGPGQY